MSNWTELVWIALGMSTMWGAGFLAGHRFGRDHAMRANAQATQQEAEEAIRRTIRAMWQGKVPSRAPHWRVLRGGQRRLP